jgi:ribonuclease E
MSEKRGKPKATKGGAKAGADPAKSVLGNLPSTRPTRMSRRRDGDDAADGATATAEPPKPKAAAKPKAANGRKATAKPKAAGAAKAKATTGPKAAAKPKPAAKPRAVRSGSPSLERPPRTEVRKPKQSGPPSGTELVTTAVQAAGELAEIGVKMGARAVKRAVDRLPKP